MSTADSTEMITPDERAGAEHFVLVGLSGAASGLELALGEREAIIGRSSTCDLRITDDQVSRRHVRLSLVPGGHHDKRSFVLIEDLASHNGLHVNGHRTGRALLERGDEILIGRSVLRLERLGPFSQFTTGGSATEPTAMPSAE